MRRLLNGLRERHADIVNWTQVQFFRLWTATAVILFFGLCFWYAPELLTWWQKTVLNIIHGGSDMLPYPWSNRVEYIMINFGARFGFNSHLPSFYCAFYVGLWLVGGDANGGGKVDFGKARDL